MLRGDMVKDDSGAHAVFTEQSSSASQMTAAKIMDVIARVPGCDGHVKSMPPTTENWLRKFYNYSMNNDKSTEDKHETNHINNKYNDTNTDTRKLHNL